MHVRERENREKAEKISPSLTLSPILTTQVELFYKQNNVNDAMDSKKLRRFRKQARAFAKTQDPEVKQAYASKLQEMGKQLTPELRTSYGERYGIKF